jgi:hypothetical protein
MDATLATLHREGLFVDEPLGLRLSGRDGVRHHYELWWGAFGAVPDDGNLHWVTDDESSGRVHTSSQTELPGVPRKRGKVSLPPLRRLHAS